MRVVRILVAVVLTVFVAVAPVIAQDEGDRSSRDERPERVAILPFGNISGVPDDDWIGAGIAEALSVEFQSRSAFDVIGRGRVSETMRIVGVLDTRPAESGMLLEVGRRVGARWVVSGGYQRLGDQLRITGRLVDVTTGAVAQAAKVDGAIDDLFELQDRLATGLINGQASDAAHAAGRSAPLSNADVTVGAESASSAPPIRLPTQALPPAAMVVGATSPVLAKTAPDLGPTEMFRRDAGGTVVRALRLAEPLTLDGRLDEALYEEIAPINGFIQQFPDDGQPATEDTDAWILFDDETLYISTRNWDSQPEHMVANEMRHDSRNLISNDHNMVVLDTFDDGRNGFLFLVTALGGMLEEVFANEGNPNRDWNTVWDAETARFDGGWTAEMAIPFKSLRYEPGAEHTWGINISRRIIHKNESTYLAPIPLEFGLGVFRVSSAATLVGLETPPLARNLEFKPYAIGNLATDRAAVPAVDNDLGGDVGLDVKYGITGGLTADFTVNTDFAQVEVDEQQVNLTRFSLFFPEKREFFLEGQSIFNFGGSSTMRGSGDIPVLFFSRQIGLSQGHAVPILGGGRLTGRVGNYDVGAANIQTGEDRATSTSPTNFTVLRLRRAVLSRSTVGALYTRRSNALSADGSNETYGVDGLFAILDTVRVNTYLARTRTPGLSGDDIAYLGQFDWNADRYGLQLERLSVGANFNPEVGFARRRDIRKTRASARFSPRPENLPLVRQFSYQADFAYITTGGGRLESRRASLEFDSEFENGDSFNLLYAREYELLEAPFQIATGVAIPAGGYGFQNVTASYQLGQRRRVSGTASMSRGSFFGGTQVAATYRGRLAIAARLAIEPVVSVNWIDLPQGAFITKLVSSRVTAPLTPRMFVSALLQYNSSNNTFSNNIRLRWEYLPGSELFVVYFEGRDVGVGRFPELENRGLVIKINRLFRL